jgi:hypothetical protein
LAEPKLASTQLAEESIALIEEIASDTAEQRQVASWLLRFAIAYYRDALERGLAGELGPAWNALLARTGGEEREAADLVAAAIDRCVLADLHIQQMMPVPLCIEGWAEDLARIHRGGMPLMV